MKNETVAKSQLTCKKISNLEKHGKKKIFLLEYKSYSKYILTHLR
uniref:Macaca fascicularis brain cDNA clone: QmoA-10327, similar to human choline phosphotransferase 1 (CHPT1), mRNA, RefSeq: NM_020244.1 n=1 Tax=Macaca fascicularis TaxID=9541 RepID=I7GJ10_MACFA|nr:unnamed protein product [Macaca fascicularis]